MNKIKNISKLVVIFIIVACFIWFLLLKPTYTFKKYEKNFINAAQKYYEYNSSLLPTGNRTSTVSLKTLYNKAFIKEDMYIPYTTTACSVTDSWVKVKKVNGDYKYTVYLKCGVLESSTDHEGPVISLNGKETITIEKGTNYKEYGVKSVIDKNEGKLDTKDVKITNNVDTSTIGVYTVTYKAKDSLLNESTVTRKVKVVETLKTTVKNVLNNKKYYVGENINNYIKLSNMIFRIVKIDDNDNIEVISENDVANINYGAIDDWLDEVYLPSLTKKSKKYLVKSKYCSDNASEDNKNTDCKSYTDKKYAYIISQTDINNTLDENNSSFLKPNTMSWVVSSKNNPLVTRNYFYEDYFGKNYYPAKYTDNYGIRPVLTIKGTSLIKSGDGSKDNPYSFNEVKKAKGGDDLNTRYTGEFVKFSGYIWRIINTESDGTTKVILYDTTNSDEGIHLTTMYEGKNIYNPKEKGNVGYLMNNYLTKFFITSYFDNHEIEVPIYKNTINYKKEIKTKKYKVIFREPDMYEMFSAFDMYETINDSYWMINSSKNNDIAAVIGENGSVINETIDRASSFGMRPVGYLKSSIIINSGGGTYKDPYIITK